MRFEEVLPALREGKKAKRQKWTRYKSVGIFKKDLGMRFGFATSPSDATTEYYPVIGIDDLLADDWQIIS